MQLLEIIQATLRSAASREHRISLLSLSLPEAGTTPSFVHREIFHDEDPFSKMSQRPFIINGSRTDLIDRKALSLALQRGTIAGICRRAL